MTTGVYLNDDVPFSCCDPKSHRPCISHHVHDNDLHYNYDYRTKTTLYGTGCADALMLFYGRKVMGNVGAIFLIIFLIQCVAMICVRLFQSSIDDAYRKGDPAGPGEGCLFSWNFGEKKTPNILTAQPSIEKEVVLHTFDGEDDEVMSVDFDTFDEGCDNVGTIPPDLPLGPCYPFPPPPPSRYRSLNRLASRDAMYMPHRGEEGYMPPPPAAQNLSRYLSMNRLPSRDIFSMQQSQPVEEDTHPAPPPSPRRYSSVNRIASRESGPVSSFLTSPPLPTGNSIFPPPPPPPSLPF